MVHGDRQKRLLRKFIIIMFWLALWQCLAAAVDNAILLSTPIGTVRALFAMLGEAGFYLTVGNSLLRLGAGFLAGFAAAVLLAACAGRFSLLEEVLSPVIGLAKAVPMASFVVLLLIWWGSSFLAVAVCFLVVLPNVYINTLEGLKNADGQLLEMAQVFRLPLWSRFFYIYRPALGPFWYSGLKVSLGMCWKAGVAAEVIGFPAHSIGGELYLSKIYLDTADVFAWTAVVVLLSCLFEKAVLYLAALFFACEPSCRRPPAAVPGVKTPTGRRNMGGAPAGGRAAPGLSLVSVTKVYDGKNVLDKVSASYAPGGTYYLTDPSGSGKTTTLHLLAGLLRPEGGYVEVPCGCSMVFQEDRLCEDYSAVKNVEMAMGSRRAAEEALGALLEGEALYKPCRQLSGGMKRRVALVRAMEADSEYVLLDEPFTGMDARTRLLAEAYIRERQRGRTLVIATHQGPMAEPEVSRKS